LANKAAFSGRLGVGRDLDEVAVVAPGAGAALGADHLQQIGRNLLIRVQFITQLSRHRLGNSTIVDQPNQGSLA
jgi:hypothetical protein